MAPVPALTKSTPNVRKILQSQKTFANHLDDYEALKTLNENNPTPPHLNQYTKPKAPHPNQYTKKPPQPNQYTKKAPQPNQYTKRRAAAAAAAEAASNSKRKETSRSRSRRGRAESEPDPEAEPEPVPGAETAAARDAAMPSEEAQQDVEMTGVAAAGPRAVLTPYDESLLPPAHLGDSDPLLVSVVPDLPSDAELRKLLAHPPLSYTEARARWRDEDKQYPARRFCDVCGYWGRVRCMKCGTPVCALDCLEMHREECITRYGL